MKTMKSRVSHYVTDLLTRSRIELSWTSEKATFFIWFFDYSQLDPLDASPFLLLNLELEVDYLISALANVMQTRANSFGHYFPPAGFQIQNFILQSKITRNVHWN